MTVMDVEEAGRVASTISPGRADPELRLRLAAWIADRLEPEESFIAAEEGNEFLPALRGLSRWLRMTPAKRAVRVWPWTDAPAAYRALSPHGGDEDWVALLPQGTDHPLWAEAGTPFGVCDVSRHELSDGRVVLIGAHA